MLFLFLFLYDGHLIHVKRFVLRSTKGTSLVVKEIYGSDGGVNPDVFQSCGIAPSNNGGRPTQRGSADKEETCLWTTFRLSARNQVLLTECTLATQSRLASHPTFAPNLTTKSNPSPTSNASMWTSCLSDERCTLWKHRAHGSSGSPKPRGVCVQYSRRHLHRIKVPAASMAPMYSNMLRYLPGCPWFKHCLCRNRVAIPKPTRVIDGQHEQFCARPYPSDLLRRPHVCGVPVRQSPHSSSVTMHQRQQTGALCYGGGGSGMVNCWCHQSWQYREPET